MHSFVPDYKFYLSNNKSYDACCRLCQSSLDVSSSWLMCLFLIPEGSWLALRFYIQYTRGCVLSARPPIWLNFCYYRKKNTHRCWHVLRQWRIPSSLNKIACSHMPSDIVPSHPKLRDTSAGPMKCQGFPHAWGSKHKSDYFLLRTCQFGISADPHLILLRKLDHVVACF